MFQIGEFSKITHVSGSQLRYYDEIGLLHPAKIDAVTGYRYYSSKQIPDLHRILALKELGLSLEQIRRMIKNDISSEEIRGMLSLKKMQVEQTVFEEVNRLRHIEARLSQLEAGVDVGDYEVILKSIPEMSFLSRRQMCLDIADASKHFVEMFQSIPAGIDKKYLGIPTAILHSDMYTEVDLDVEMGFILSEPHTIEQRMLEGMKMSVSMLPAVEMMVTAVQVGLPDESYTCRNFLAAWLETNNYVITGIGRDVFLVPPQPGREAETVIEIQYPVQPSEILNLPKELAN
jgi:DNA-binding transcriptional MerR regulator